MPPRKTRRRKATRPLQELPLDGHEQLTDSPCSLSQDEEERDTADESVTEPEPEGDETDLPARKRTAPRVITTFSEDAKEQIIDFLQQNPILYSKRLSGYKDAAAKDRLWTEQARQMQCTPSELKTWYDSMRTKLGKLKKAVTKSGQAADRFTATERWIWQHFQFLSEHITQITRRTVASFSARLQPAAAGAPPPGPTLEASDETPFTPIATVCTPSAPSDCGTSSPPTSSTAGSNPDVLMSLLETYLTERQNRVHPATAFGSFDDGSLRNLPPSIRRTAETKIMEVLHECQNEMDRQQHRPLEPHSMQVKLIEPGHSVCRKSSVQPVVQGNLLSGNGSHPLSVAFTSQQPTRCVALH